nr:facilitated trehalose transporter Tret1-like [Onthophagus taurus]
MTQQEKESSQEGLSKHSRTFLFLTSLIVNLLSFTCGIIFAWTSPVIPKLKQNDTPLDHKITIEEISWLAPLVSLGSAFGPFLGGFLVDKIGRKLSLVICAIPLTVTFICLAFSTMIELYYLSRFIMGLAIGIFMTVQPMFIGEITEITNRGMIGCLTVAFITCGNLFSFSLGPYVTLKTFNLISSVFPLTFIILFIVFIPESPTYLIKKNKYNEAKTALLKYRGGDKKLVDEELLQTIDAKSTENGGISEILKTKSLKKGLIVTCGLMIVQQLTAISVVLFYLQTIFDSSGINVSSEIATIIIGIVQIISSVSASLTVEKAGRKVLFLISISGTCLTLITLGYYFHLKENHLEVSHLSWLPILALMIYIATYNFGAGPIPLPVLSEIFPPHVMSVAATLTICVCFSCSFVCSKFYPLLAVQIGTAVSFWGFAALNAVGIGFVSVCMPETKGKSRNEILAILDK